MVAVLYLFMDKFVAERLPEEFEAFKLLYHILGIFRLGPEDAMDHIDTLNTLLREHLDKVVKLYDEHVKPKGHHAFHMWMECCGSESFFLVLLQNESTRK